MPKCHATHLEDGNGHPIPDIFCDCGEKIVQYWSSCAEDSKTMSVTCPACGKSFRVQMTRNGTDWKCEILG